MIFGKAINRYYLKHAPVLLLGILSLLTVDYIQLLIPELYRLVINGVNLGQVVVDGQTLPALPGGAVSAHLPANDLDRRAHGHRAVPVACLFLRVSGQRGRRFAGADVCHSRRLSQLVLSGQQGRQPDEPLHQRPRHHSGVLRRRHFDVL